MPNVGDEPLVWLRGSHQKGKQKNTIKHMRRLGSKLQKISSDWQQGNFQESNHLPSAFCVLDLASLLCTAADIPRLGSKQMSPSHKDDGRSGSRLLGQIPGAPSLRRAALGRCVK